MSGELEIVAQMEEPKQRIAFVAQPDSRPAPSFSRRIPELDGLRGVAIVICIFFHYVWYAIAAQPPELLGYISTSGRLLWAGVDLFFVISGFLIGGILLDARNSPNYFTTFYMRRFCRILPVYLLFIGLMGLAYRFVYRPVGAQVNWIFGSVLPWYSYLSFAQNLWMAKWNSLGSRILSITWSLSVEEQFYLVLPLIIRFVRRSALPYVFVSGILFAPLARLFIIHQYRTHIWATYVLLPCRMDSLLLGALCAYCIRQPKIWSWLVEHRNTIWMLLLVLLAGMPALSTKGIPLTILYAVVGYGWMSLFFSTVLLLVLVDSRSSLSRMLRWAWLARLGEIAYGAYLFHLAIYFFCMWLLTGHGWLLASWRDLGVTLLAAAITIVFGKLSWRYFEKPFVRWGHHWQY